jgi:hypothetical protein
MKKTVNIIISLSCMLLFTVRCSPTNQTEQKSKQISELNSRIYYHENDSIVKKIEHFWIQFRTAIKKREINHLTNFPLEVECFADKTRGKRLL